MSTPNFTYLALGDSYTIGEGVELFENYPNQTVQLLRKKGHPFNAPEIIAQTGWTTRELGNSLAQRELLSSYSIVSLLIGVNNQYQGLSVEQYENEFNELLRFSIGRAAGISAHVFVLPIPDWGLTPFANGRDTEVISREISQFNSVNRAISRLAGVNYINLSTARTETCGDGLHPSANAYGEWANLLAASIMSILK